jgi:hypothetical protein
MENNGTSQDIWDYPANRNKFPGEELAKYRGQYVAFSLDGKRILASGPDRQSLSQEMVKLNLPHDQVVVDYIEGEGTSEAEWEQAAALFHQETASEPNGPPPPPPDIRDYSVNRSQFPLEELARYAGLHVAFSPDGKRILASGPDRQSLRKELHKQGIHPSQVVHSYVDPL